MTNLKIKWPNLHFPPINPWNSPAKVKECDHTWMYLYSLHKRVCYDCGIEKKLTRKEPIEHRQSK